MARCAGPSRVPVSSTRLPASRSLPAGLTAVPASVATLMATRSEPPSVCSTCTTVSAPAGIGAPVMILMACPRPTARLGTLPAATSSRTSRRAGSSIRSAASTA